MKKGLALRFKKNGRERVRVMCKGEDPWVCKSGCFWILYASKGQDYIFKIKSYEPKHKCCRTNKSKMVTYEFLAKHFRNKIIFQCNITQRQLKELCKTKLKLYVTMSICQKVKKKVIDEENGRFRAKYDLFHDYVKELKISNSCNIIDVKHNDKDAEKNPYFQKFYMCFAACKQG